jgi:hypothetical protein
MSDVQFQPQGVQQLWDRLRQGQTAPKDNAVAKALSDHQLTRSEYDQLKTLYLKDNPGGDFDQFLADALDGKLDNKAAAPLKDALNQFSQQGSATVAISFNLNEHQNGYANIAAVTFRPREETLLQQVKDADTDRNGRLEGAEKQKLKQMIGNGSGPENALLSNQLQDQLSSVSYNAQAKTVTVFLGDAIPQLSGRHDVRVNGTLMLEDIDGINDRSRNDIQGKVDGQIDIDYGLLSKAIRDALNPNLPGNSGSIAGLSGGYQLALKGERFDSARNAYVVNATATLSAGASVSAFGYSVGGSTSHDLDMEVVIRPNARGELSISAPALDDVSIPGVRAAAWAARDKIMTTVRDQIAAQVDGKDMGIKFNPRVETTQGTFKNWRRANETGPIKQEIVLEPALELKLNNPFPAPPGQNPTEMALRLQANRGNTTTHIDNRGIHLGLNQVPVSGSSDAKATAVASRDRQSDKIDLNVQYGLNIDLKSGQLDHDIAIQNGTARIDLEAGEIEDFPSAASAAKMAGATGTAEMQLRGRMQSNRQGQQGQVQGKLTVETDKGEAFTHFRTAAASGQTTPVTIATAGTEVTYQAQGQKIKARSESGSVQAGSELQVRLYNAQGEAQLNATNLQLIQQQLQAGNQQLLGALQKAGLNDSLVQRLTHGSRSDLSSLLKNEALTGPLQQALVALKADRWQIDIDAQGARTQAHNVSATATAQGTTGANLNASVQARTLSADSTQGATVQAEEVALKASAQSADGSVQAEAEGQARRAQVGEVVSTQDTTLTARLTQQGEGPQTILSAGVSGGDLRLDQEGLTAEAIQAEARAKVDNGQGNQGEASLDLRQVRAARKPDGSWVLATPDATTKVTLDTTLPRLQEMARNLGPEGLDKLLKNPDPAALRSGLEAAGLSAAQSRQAASILSHPRMRELVATSDFAQALQQSERIQIEASAQTRIDAGQDASGNLQVNATGNSVTGIQLQGPENQTVVAATARTEGLSVTHAQGETDITAAQAGAEAHGYRLDGSEFAAVAAKARDVKLELEAKRQQLTTGEASLNADIDTVLKAEKIAKIQEVLVEVKDRIQERLQSFGLSKQQFENLISAFGRDQLAKLFTSASREDIESLSKEFGISHSQLNRVMELMNDQQFQQMLEDVHGFSSMLNDAQLSGQLNLTAANTRWTHQDNQMVMQARQLAADLRLSTGHADGQMNARIQGTQAETTVTLKTDGSQTTWGQGTASLDLKATNAAGHVLTAEAQLNQAAGSFARTVTGDEQLDFNGLEVTGEIRSHQPERDANLRATGGIERIQAARIQGQDTLRLDGSKVSGTARVNDARQQSVVEADVQMKRLDSAPEQVSIQGLEVGGDVRARIRDQENNESRYTVGRTQARTGFESLNVKAGEAQIAGIHMEGKTEASLFDKDTRNLHLAAEMNNGQITTITGREGHVDIQGVTADISASATTPVGQGQVSGQVSVDSMQAQDGQITSEGFALDAINGKVRVKTDKMRQMLESSPAALHIMDTLSKNWADKHRARTAGANIFENDTLTLQIDKGRIANENLTGRLTLPDLKTRLGDAQLDIQLQRLDFSQAAKPQVEVSGKAHFQPKQPDFAIGVNNLLKDQFKAWGLPELNTSVSLEKGEFKVKIDRWFADGLIKVGFENDQMQLTLDKAKFLRFLSVRGLVTNQVAQRLDRQMIGFNQDDNRLNIALNDLTEQILTRDNLRIQGVKLGRDNRFEIDFAYTDTESYNRSASQRRATRLDERLLTDTRTGKARSNDDLENVVEDMSAPQLRTIFRDGTPAQLRRVLQSVGNDYDNILRKLLTEEKKMSDYPVANRAIMAAWLAHDGGFLESVDAREKQLIQQIATSLKASERTAFWATLNGDEQKRLRRFLAP